MTTQTRQTVQATGSSSVAAPTWPDRRQPSHSPSGDVVLAYLETHAATLRALDPAVRRDEPDSVHQMRVAARRLRSTLQAYPAIVSGRATQHMRDELKWLGAMLAEFRDNEV